MKFGIDGCKAGWLAVWTQGNNYRFGVLRLLKKYLIKPPNLKPTSLIYQLA